MSKFWEVIQLTDGSFALQNSETDDEPLVTIQFSDKAEAMLQNQLTDVVRAMIAAGIESANVADDEYDQDSEVESPTIVH